MRPDLTTDNSTLRKEAMDPGSNEMSGGAAAQPCTPGKAYDGRCKSAEESDAQEEEKDQQVSILPTELLNHILSYTGTPAAVLAAGPAGMRAWSAANIAEWLHQHYAATGTDRASLTTALCQAIKHHLNATFSKLFERLGDTNPDAGCKEKILSTVQASAAEYGNIGIIDTVLIGLRPADIEFAREAVELMMTQACKAGQLQVVKKLLDDSRPHACYPDGDSGKYLITAAQYGHVGVVKELLDPACEHCAKANACNSQALDIAATYGHANVLLELLDTSREHHANANDNNCHALCLAAMIGHLDCVRVLLDTSRANCATADASNNTPLSAAVIAGHLHIVQELLDTSRPNHATADAHGSAAVNFAAACGHTDVLRELLCQEHHPADPLSPAGEEALEKAVTRGNLACCRLLLGYPDLPPRNLDKRLLETAADIGNPEVLALLQEVKRRFQADETC